jgi:hypothetical protein
MAGFLLPLLGYGATALGVGATGVGLYSGYEDLKDKYTKKAYETGPDLQGNFDTGSILGNIIVGEETKEFKDKYIPTARREDSELNQMITLLGDKFQRGDGKQTIQQLKDLNMPAARLAKQEQDLELEQGTTKYKRAEEDRDFTRKQYADQLRATQEARLDALNFNRMQMAREDQRYNERLDREERNRRQEAVMAMMGGLTSLGAAFAM